MYPIRIRAKPVVFINKRVGAVKFLASALKMTLPVCYLHISLQYNNEVSKLDPSAPKRL
jgi:hypothetical protein